MEGDVAGLAAKKTAAPFLPRAVGFVQHNLWSNNQKRQLLESDQSGVDEAAGAAEFQRK